MAPRSTSSQYGTVAVMIHWSSALAVILTFAAGFSVANLAASPPVLVVHIILGSIVLLLTLLRIVWWVVVDKRPAPPANQPRWQQRIASWVHILLYVLLLMMASSGIVTLVLSGALPTILSDGPIPDLSALIPRIAHGVMSKLLLVLFIVHVGAAIYHQVIRRDRLMARMGVGPA